MLARNPQAGWARRLVGWFSRNVPPEDDPRRETVAAEPAVDPILQRLDAMERRLSAIERGMQGGRSTYMGNGLVLVKVVVNGAQIAYLVEADDRLISPWFITAGEYETALTEHFVATLRPDDRCLDIGANFGYFTCLMARFCPAGRVIGVEPDPKVFAILRDNVNMNGFGDFATAHLGAVLDTVRTVTLHRRMGRSGNTGIIPPTSDFVERLGEKPSEAFTAQGVTVDVLADALAGRVDVMKVDVEGAEPLVLAGAANTIHANPDLQLVLEWSPGQLQAAGHDAGVFIDRMLSMGLAPHALGLGGRMIQRDVLLGSGYMAGVLFARFAR